MDDERIWEALCVLVLGILAILAALSLSGCGTAPIFQGTWAPDSERQSVRRAQENREIKCSDKQFETLVCMTPESAWAIKNSCKSSSLP